MTMAIFEKSAPDPLGKTGRFLLGVAFFFVYVFVALACRRFYAFWELTYLLFFTAAVAWSVAQKKAALLLGFLAGTAVSVGLCAAFIYFVLSNMKC
jgi:hypothetical protein